MFFNLEALYHGFIIPWVEAHARHEVCDVRYHNCTGRGRPLLKEESAGIDLCCCLKCTTNCGQLFARVVLQHCTFGSKLT